MKNAIRKQDIIENGIVFLAIKRQKMKIKEWEKKYKKKYDTRGMKETCLNCGKETCGLAGDGNQAGINENSGCWIPVKKVKT